MDVWPVIAVVLGTVAALGWAAAAVGWHEADQRGREVARRRRQQRVLVEVIEAPPLPRSGVNPR